jgi:uncharacterized protein (DUF1499 family)
VKYAALAILILVVVGLAYVRFARDAASVWHVDPLTVTRGPDPNQYLVRDGDGDIDSPVFDEDAAVLARRFDGVAMSMPRVTRLEGGPDQLWMTYIQRSKWIGFPDYISVRALPAEPSGAKLVVYSRSRYGRGDLGVNQERITKWLAALTDRFQ